MMYKRVIISKATAYNKITDNNKKSNNQINKICKKVK